MSTEEEEWAGEEDINLLILLIENGWSKWKEILQSATATGVLNRSKEEIYTHARKWLRNFGGQQLKDFINHLHIAYLHMQSNAGNARNGRLSMLTPTTTPPQFSLALDNTITTQSSDEGDNQLPPSPHSDEGHADFDAFLPPLPEM